MTFQKGENGNPAGRPRGARNKRTLAAESSFDREGGAIVEQLIKLAKEGSVAAMRLCIDRICPRQRDRPVAFELPPMTSATDAIPAMAAIIQGVGDADLTPHEAAELAKMVAAFSQTIATAELEQRMREIERRLAVLDQQRAA